MTFFVLTSTWLQRQVMLPHFTEVFARYTLNLEEGGKYEDQIITNSEVNRNSKSAYGLHSTIGSGTKPLKTKISLKNPAGQMPLIKDPPGKTPPAKSSNKFCGKLKNELSESKW